MKKFKNIVFNSGNKRSYNLLYLDNATDYTTALLEERDYKAVQPYVLAIGFNNESGTWDSGHYYSNFNDARNAFIDYIK